MRFNSARQVLTDSLSIHHTSPDPDAVKVDIYWKDNDSRIAHCCEAGKVLNVVGKYSPLLSSFCYVMCAPNCTEKNVRTIQNYVLKKYADNNTIGSIYGDCRAIVRHVRLIELALAEVQHLERCGKHLFSDADVARELFNMDKRNYERHWKPVFIKLKDIIHDLAPKALGPVSDVVEREKRKYEADAMR